MRWQYFLLINLFLMNFFCGNSTENKKPIHNEKSMISGMHILPLNNEEYWLIPKSKINEFTWNILEEEKECLLIDGPDFVPLNLRTTLPIIMVGARNESISFKNRFKGKTFGICSNLLTGELKIGLVHRPPDVINDTDQSSSGLIVQDYTIDLRSFLDVEWNPCIYKIWFIYYDLLSNGITCHLSKDESAFGSDDEVQLFKEITVQAKRRSILYEQGIEYPDENKSVSLETGISISKESNSSSEKIISISGVLPVLSHQIVKESEKTGPLSGVNAIMPLDVIIVRTQGTREQLRTGVPCKMGLTSIQERIHGSFNVRIDLGMILQEEICKEEKVYIYTFSGEFAAGPLEINN